MWGHSCSRAQCTAVGSHKARVVLFDAMTKPVQTSQPPPQVPPLAAWEVRRRFLLFLAPGVFQVGMSFVTLPLTTLVLGPTDFAIFSLVASFSALAMSLSQMGSGFLVTQRFRHGTAEEQYGLVTTLTVLVFASSLAFAAILIIAFLVVHDTWSVTAGITLSMVLLIAVERIGTSIHIFSATVSSFGNTPGYYSFVSITKSIVAAGTTLAALFVFHLHVMALFVGYAAGGVAALIGSLAMLSRFFIARIDWTTLKDALYLGGWSTLTFLIVQARVTVERALLTKYTGLYDLGIFTHAQQYQSLVLLGSRPIQSAVAPVTLDETKEKQQRFARTGRTSNVVYLGITALGVAMALFGRIIIGLLTHDKFSDAAPYAALLVGVMLLQLSGRPQFYYLMLQGRGRYISLSSSLAAVVAMLTLFVLLQFVGLAAAVSASYVQYLVFRMATGIDPHRSVSLPFQDRGVIVGILVIVGMVAFEEYFGPGLLLRALVFVGFLAATTVLAHSTVVDALLQVQDHLGLRKKMTSGSGIPIGD
jgi:O-antigen/teichoic acid export membrane protein